MQTWRIHFLAEQRAARGVWPRGNVNDGRHIVDTQPITGHCGSTLFTYNMQIPEEKRPGLHRVILEDAERAMGTLHAELPPHCVDATHRPQCVATCALIVALLSHGLKTLWRKGEAAALRTAKQMLKGKKQQHAEHLMTSGDAYATAGKLDLAVAAWTAARQRLVLQVCCSPPNLRRRKMSSRRCDASSFSVAPAWC